MISVPGIFLIKLEAYVFSFPGCYIRYAEGIFFCRGNGYGLFYVLAGISLQLYNPRDHRNKFFHVSGYAQYQSRVFSIIGLNNDLFKELLSAEVPCVDFYGNFSLSAGRDLSRIRDMGTPSVGSHALNQQRCSARVLNHEIMEDFLTIKHGIEYIAFSRN